jgi:DNA-binding CsgD family transcriptional regulator/tetratricopeptide (TPR) repeat protein
MELLERERFLNELAAALTRAKAGGGCTVLVGGEAGIGKTALVEQFVAPYREHTRVLWGSCDALFTPRPLGPLRDISQQTDGGLLSLINGEASRAAIFDATLSLLQAQSPATIVVLEDLHWADEATLDLVKFLGRRMHRTQSLLILTYRDDEIGPQHPMRFVLGHLPNAGLTRFSLPPLTQEAVSELARRAGREAKGVHAVTGGNPFFVQEMLASSEGSVPGTVRDAVLARAARLSAAARAVLELVAVVPARTERWLLHAVLVPAPAAIDECVEAGMLRLQERGVAFKHELARRAIEDSLPPARFQALHAQVLGALVARPERDVEIAEMVHHASCAGDGDAVLRYAPLAARQASSLGAHRQAAVHYATALRFAKTSEPQQYAELLENRGHECYLTGQLEYARDARLSALAIFERLGHREKEGRNHRHLARVFSSLGKRKEAERHVARAVEILEELPPGRELAMAYSARAQLHMLASEDAEAIQWGMKALELARALGDHETLVHALNNVGMAQYHQDDLDGRAGVEESLRLALEHGFEEHAARALGNLGVRAVMRREFAIGARYLTENLRYASERDLDAYAQYARAWLARTECEQGRWHEAAEEAAKVLEMEAYGHPPTRLSALVVLARVRARRGDLEAAPLLDEAWRVATDAGELQRIAPVAATRAELAWLQGRREDTVAEARPAYELAVARNDAWFIGELAFWMWRGGGLAAPPPGAAEPYALQIAGDWRAAAEAWERIGCPYERAMALMDGDERAQRTALEIVERLGARPAVDVLRRRLREGGVRGLPRGPRSTTAGNPAHLTEREMEIAALLRISNADIAARLHLSARTVEHHVSSILSKLGVRTRIEAIDVVRQLGIAATAGRSPSQSL